MSLELKHVRLARSGTYTCDANVTTIIRTQNMTFVVQDWNNLNRLSKLHKGKKLKISYIAIYSEASYVDNLWLFNGSGKQTNFKYEVNDARFRRCTEGTIKSKNISFTLYYAGLNDSGQYSCVLNISRGSRLKNVSVQVIPDVIGKFLLSLYLPSGGGIGCLEPIDDSNQKAVFLSFISLKF